MAITFPVTPPTVDRTRIRRGPLEFWIGDYVISGGDMTPNYVMPIGPEITVTIGRTVVKFDVMSELAAIDAMVSAAQCTVAVNVMDSQLASLAKFLNDIGDNRIAGGGAGDSLTGGSGATATGTAYVPGSFLFGSSFALTHHQIAVRGASIPAGGANLRRVWQIWDAVCTSAISIKGGRMQGDSYQLTFDALADPTARAAGVGAICRIAES